VLTPRNRREVRERPFPPDSLSQDDTIMAVQDAFLTQSAISDFPERFRSRRSLLEAIEERFRDSGYSALQSISFEAENGRVRLRGRLPSYYLKQLAQTIVSHVDGVKSIENVIDVSSSN
jgi:hypothetical protein